MALGKIKDCHKRDFPRHRKERNLPRHPRLNISICSILKINIFYFFILYYNLVKLYCQSYNSFSMIFILPINQSIVGNYHRFHYILHFECRFKQILDIVCAIDDNFIRFPWINLLCFLDCSM